MYFFFYIYGNLVFFLYISCQTMAYFQLCFFHRMTFFHLLPNTLAEVCLKIFPTFFSISFTSLILTSCNKGILSNLFTIFFISLFLLTVRYSINSSFLQLSQLTGLEIFLFSADNKQISTEKLNCRAQCTSENNGS